MKPVFFASPSEFRSWLEKHHDTTSELLVGFYKKASGKPSITWPEAVEQALCFGWIDGVRKGIDDIRYTIRFTPRAARSTWSAVNIKKANDLIESGLMQPAGLEAFKKRTEAKSGIYSYEQRHTAQLDETQEHSSAPTRRRGTSFNPSRPHTERPSSGGW